MVGVKKIVTAAWVATAVNSRVSEATPISALAGNLVEGAKSESVLVSRPTPVTANLRSRRIDTANPEELLEQESDNSGIVISIAFAVSNIFAAALLISEVMRGFEDEVEAQNPSTIIQPLTNQLHPAMMPNLTR
jgi:hypothetical protein